MKRSIPPSTSEHWGRLARAADISVDDVQRIYDGRAQASVKTFVRLRKVAFHLGLEGPPSSAQSLGGGAV